MWSSTTLGFDDLFREFDVAFNKTAKATFPLYNVYTDKEEGNNPSKYTIELALSGYKREDIDVTLEEKGSRTVLTIQSTGRDAQKDDPSDHRHYSIKQIAHRSFKQQFTMRNDLKVDEVKLEDGLLIISMSLTPQKSDAVKRLSIK